MLRSVFRVLGTFVTASTVSVLLAFPVGRLDVTPLAADSDVIVVGSVKRPRSLGSTTVFVGGQAVEATRMTVEVIVRRVIKGAVDSERVSLEYDIPQRFVGYEAPAPDSTALLFLRRTEGGKLAFSSPGYPEVVAGELCENDAVGPGSATANEVLKRIAAELACVALDDSTPVARRAEAITALASTDAVEAIAALRSAAESADPSVRAAGLTGLLRRHDTSLFDQAVEILMNPAVPESTKGDLAEAIHGTGDPKTVAMLERLVGSGDVFVRRAAASALRNTHSQAAIRGLGKAIEDSDGWVRYQGVAGLGEITRQDEWTPSTDNFAAHEEKFLTHWREWLANRKP